MISTILFKARKNMRYQDLVLGVFRRSGEFVPTLK